MVSCRFSGDRIRLRPISRRRDTAEAVRQAKSDTAERTGPTSGELAKIRRLKRENGDLRETNNILKAAASCASRVPSSLHGTYRVWKTRAAALPARRVTRS